MAAPLAVTAATSERALTTTAAADRGTTSLAVTSRRSWLAVGALTALALLLRVPTLDHQSFWIDEAAVANLLALGHGDLLAELRTQTSPPLYYPLIIGWSAIFGTSEVALRSLSALFGCLTVPLAYPLVKRIVDARAGVIAAAFVATSPEMVWFSQEARPYSLLVLLSALTLYLTVRAAQEGGARLHGLWALTAAAAVCTHYFSVFILIPQALWLLSVRAHRRTALLALAGLTAVGLALAPLMLGQAGRGYWPYYSDLSLLVRARAIPGALLLGEVRPIPAFALVATGIVLSTTAIGLAVAAAWPARRRSAGARDVLRSLAVGAFALSAPLALALTGIDYVSPHNFLAIWFPLAAVAAAGCAVRRTRPLGTVIAVALCTMNVAVVAIVYATPRYQRDDWRGALAAIGTSHGTRALVFPTAHVDAVGYYARGSGPAPAGGVAVDEIDVFLAGRPEEPAPPWPRVVAAPAPGFHEVGRQTVQHIRVVRFRAARPVRVTAAQLTAARAGVTRPAALIQPSASARR